MAISPQSVLATLRRGGDHAPGSPAEAAERWLETLTHRVVIVVASVGLFWGSFETYGNGLRYSWIGVAAVAGFVLPTVIAMLALCSRDERTLARLDVLVLLTGLLVFVAWTLPAIHTWPQHQSDEASLVDYAALLLRQGHNPYTADLASAYLHYQIPANDFTPLIGGSVAGQLGYPPVSVLLSAVLMPLAGTGTSALAVAILLAMVLTAALLFCCLPRSWRSLGMVIIVGFPAYNALTFFGLTEMLLLPLLVIVAFRWNRIGAGGRLGWGGVARAAALGVAAATQQLTWFFIPFVLVGIYLLRRGELPRREALAVVARFTAIAAGVFAVINLPFAIWGFREWLAAIFAPIIQHAVPIGNAFVGLAPMAHLGGGALDLYSYAGFAAVLVLLVAYAMYFHRLGPACFVLPAVAELFPTRSLAVYMMAPAAVWLVSVLTVDHDAIARVPPLLRGRVSGAVRRWSIVALAMLPIGLLAVAVATPGPLQMKITNLASQGPDQFYRDLQVKVTNTSDTALEPHFMVTTAVETGSPFWTIVQGPLRLGAHQSATYALAAPSGAYVPGEFTPFRLEAVTDEPQTASWSNSYTPHQYFADLPVPPDAISLHMGESYTFQMHLQSMVGGPVQRMGVHVTFAIREVRPDGTKIAPQTIVMQGMPPGTAVRNTRTDANGESTLTLTCVNPSANVTVLSAWLETGEVTYGFSTEVPIRCNP